MHLRALVALALTLPLLAGCLGSDRDDDAMAELPPLTANSIRVPDGAQLEAIDGGFALVWPGVALPLAADITLPPGATMVRVVADEGSSGISIVNSETGRRRCNNPTVDSFSEGPPTPRSCSSITAIDPVGTEWTVRVNGGGGPVDPVGVLPASGSSSPAEVRIEFLSTPLDGVAGMLDFTQVDPPILGVQPTTVEFIPSFDGTLLRVETTLPEGSGPWPVIIESSPYHDDGVRAEPSSYAYFAEDWARRGYAIVVADVRGFGDSGGCVEVWGPSEQRDQLVLVEWAAAQPWSDGNVGFYGQSYVGTTPVEAAVQAPPALKAIIAVAPVINAYEDWHFGGVPNGESRLSPAAYQAATEGTVTGAPSGLQEQNLRTDPVQLLNNLGNGFCDPTLSARANDPRTTYTTAFGFYEERDFKLRAKDITAAVMYTQGFEDANVKGAMIPGFFNEITAPKLGVFGHWLHQHPSRLDTEALMVGWMEQHLKGRDIGFERIPQALIQVDGETERWSHEWPPSMPTVTSLYPDLLSSYLEAEPVDGSATVYLDSAGSPVLLPTAPAQYSREFSITLDHDVSLAGTATLHVVGMLTGASNGYLAADLYEGESLLTWGQLNLAHNADHTEYTPVVSGETIERDLPFRPTERLLRAGTELTLVLRGAAVSESTDPGGAGGVSFMFDGGEDGTRLDLPGADLAEYQPIALTGRP